MNDMLATIDLSEWLALKSENGRLDSENIKLATALRNAREALDVARTGCACSVAERASGHHVDCYVPQIKEAIEVADIALGLPPPVDNDHVAPGCEQFGSVPQRSGDGK